MSRTTASTPLAASLVTKDMSPGTTFVFLFAGPATNAATITMVARFPGKRSTVPYVGVISLALWYQDSCWIDST